MQLNQLIMKYLEVKPNWNPILDCILSRKSNEIRNNDSIYRSANRTTRRCGNDNMSS